MTIIEERETHVRNVVEKYRWWDNLEIKDDLASQASDFVAIMLNYDHDFNISSAIRNANAFNIKRVYIVGRRRVDMRGSVGAHHYMDIQKVPDIAPVMSELRAEGYRIVAAELTDDAVPLTSYVWQQKTAVIFGQESLGVDEETLAAVDDVIEMPMRGSVRSINTANISGVFMFHYSAQLGLI